ncbi:helix-turn-helix domain-containing protein [Nonomuraea jiangxiensis]|uniref:AraC-like ligand-binding domain-containing protein n=1 Tax=Nonomuraea jiangxiensis TaxID=633440 RepID=UPI000B8799E2|nr:helix-turn-helix domain-containing protein [Nonomuraea jiangxiensis]
MSTNDMPPAERFDRWSDHLWKVIAPMRVRCDDPQTFQGHIAGMDLDTVQISSVTSTPCDGRRTRQMIRRSDPERFQLAFDQYGSTTISQDRRTAQARPMDLVLFHTSRPSEAATFDVGTRGIMVVFPGDLLPLPSRKLERLTATVLPGGGRVGRLLTGFLSSLVAGGPAYGPADRMRLGVVVADLMTALLAHHLDAEDNLPREVRERSLLLRVRAFIQQHLADHDLSPATVAAAHGLSVRSLHRLFAEENAGVAAFIRAERLARCRRDLADPAREGVPIHAVAARWGFFESASFTRAFRAAFGVTPQEFRRAAAQGRLPEDGARPVGTRQDSSADHPPLAPVSAADVLPQRSNQELTRANRDLTKDLAVARAQAEAAEQAAATAEAAAGQARAELDREREQHAGEADRLRQELDRARTELAQARERHTAETDRLREDLAAVREQLGDVRGRLTAAQAEARTVRQQSAGTLPATTPSPN